MADTSIQMERHYELWKEHTKQMGRWVFVVLFVGVFVPWKVLNPFLVSSKDLENKNSVLRTSNFNLKVTKEKERTVLELKPELKKLQSNEAMKAWVGPIEKLKEDFREFRNALSNLRRQNPERIFNQLEREQPEQMMAPMAQSVPTQGLGSSTENPLGKMLDMLHITADDLLVNNGEPTERPKFISREKWVELLEKRQSEVPQQMANNAILQTVKVVEERAITPVQKIVDKSRVQEKTDLLTDQLEILKNDLSKWKDKNFDNNKWYQTIGTKNDEIEAVKNTMKSWQDTFQAALDEKKTRLQEELQSHRKTINETKQTILDTQFKLESLEAKLNSLLPDWLKYLFDLDEVFQLYPFALLGMTCFLGLKANLVRDHFLKIKNSVIPQDLVLQDSSVSSIWTLIYRGRSGTLTTAFTYLAVISALWILFEWGINLTGEWIDQFSDKTETQTWPILIDNFDVLPWLGRIIFLLSFLSFTAAIYSDRKGIQQGKV